MKKFIITLFIILFVPLVACARVNVAFTIDNNYPLFTSILIDSILKNSNSDFTFWVVENNITDKNKEKMRAYVEDDMHQEIKFIHFDTFQIDQGTNFFTYTGKITPIGMARIMLPDLLPKDVHRVIYLDSDMIATGDLTLLYNTDLGHYTVGMVQNIVPSETPGLYKYKDYYNSGMILMDLDKCRKENSPKQMIDYLNAHKELFIYDVKDPEKVRYKYPDQDLINIVWHGKIKELETRWNNQSIRGQSMINALQYGIIHYIGSVKPWDFDGWSGYMYMEIYYEAWRTSPFASSMRKYFFKKFVNDYKLMVIKKCKRYKSFFKKVKNRSKESIPQLFYFYNRIIK